MDAWAPRRRLFSLAARGRGSVCGDKMQERTPDAGPYAASASWGAHVGSKEDEKHLRPIERRILDLVRAGVREPDIANRFRRSPAYVRRVVELADVPRREFARTVEQLRPVERRVLRLLEEGARPADIAARLRRTPAYVLQVERLARHKLSAAVGGGDRRDE